MKKTFVISLLCIVYFLLHIPSVHADYVLPYPSYMPGNKMYRVTRLIDKVKQYWYWGNISQIKYHLGLSDKYLVEAKTLMEYNQYLLATDALVRSDKEFQQLPTYVQGAKNEHVDIARYKQLIVEAGKKHTEILSTLALLVPAKFRWTPEKAKATDLKLQDMLTTSVGIRSKVVNETVAL
jgi:hypothetical protein